MKNLMMFTLFVLGENLLILSSSLYAFDEVCTLEVSAGKTDREKCVVSFELPENFQSAKALSLIRSADGKSIPVQLDLTAERWHAVWIVQKPLAAGSSRKYQLRKVKQPVHPPAVSLKEDEKQILIQIGSQPVLVYHLATVPSPLPNQPYYARSGYIHPLYAPSGQMITDDFNPDHAHQHGIMLAWRKMLYSGRHTNGWDQKSQLGRVEHAELKSTASGPVYGQIQALLKHVDISGKDGPVTMLNETWKIRVYALAESYLFDIVSMQKCATSEPVEMEKVHYGGMTIRGHADWHTTGAYDYLTSQGKTKKDGNETRPRWVAMHGLLKQQPVSVTIFDHPENFRFPQPVRLHPKMPYFCFAPSQIDAFRIEPGKPFVSKYRYYVQSGKPAVVVANREWENYTRPLQVRLIK